MPPVCRSGTKCKYYEEHGMICWSVACQCELWDSSAYLPKTGGTSLFTLGLLGKAQLCMLWQLFGKGWIQSLLALHSMVFVFHIELLIWNIRWLLKDFVIVGHYPPISERLFCRVWEVCKQDEHGNQENQGQQQSVNPNFHEDEPPHKIVLGAGR